MLKRRINLASLKIACQSPVRIPAEISIAENGCNTVTLVERQVFPLSGRPGSLLFCSPLFAIPMAVRASAPAPRPGHEREAGTGVISLDAGNYPFLDIRFSYLET